MFDKASQASSISSGAFRDVGGVMYKGHRIERAAYLPRRRAVGAREVFVDGAGDGGLRAVEDEQSFLGRRSFHTQAPALLQVVKTCALVLSAAPKARVYTTS